MPIVFDAATDGTVGVSTFAHTVGTGADRYLIVAAARDGGGGPSGVTYNGVAMTSIGSSTTGTFTVSVYALANPASGANNVVASGLSGTFTVVAASYAGALPAIDASTTHTGSGVTYTKALTTLANNAWIVFVTVNDINSASASTGSTLRKNGTGIPVDLFDSNAGLTPGSNSMSVTQAGGPNWASVMVSLAPVVPSMLTVF